jgi:hypothetical protein
MSSVWHTVARKNAGLQCLQDRLVVVAQPVTLPLAYCECGGGTVRATDATYGRPRNAQPSTVRGPTLQQIGLPYRFLRASTSSSGSFARLVLPVIYYTLQLEPVSHRDQRRLESVQGSRLQDLEPAEVVPLKAPYEVQTSLNLQGLAAKY